MQDYNLKPCPFCGGRKIELVEPDYFFGSWFCECTACRQAIAAGKTLEKAMKKWNRREPDLYDIPDVEVRFWLRKPTEDEREAAKWLPEEKKNKKDGEDDE